MGSMLRYNVQNWRFNNSGKHILHYPNLFFNFEVIVMGFLAKMDDPRFNGLSATNAEYCQHIGRC
ncbi:hypothetical protein M5K25_005591 [Dendrobium thyrsiflorum]|uniref:Uncharacterized protein n=1 Tax=Dendrobium thyrsiflorum TaxID=117978 RepID=A0ABD0VHY0_DENTH